MSHDHLAPHAPDEGDDQGVGAEVGMPEVGPLPRLTQRSPGRRLAKKTEPPPCPLTPEQRLLILDAWKRSGLPAGDFAPLVHLSKHTLYAWKKKFDTEGPAGLMDKPRGAPEGSRLPELTKHTILMLKEAHPDYGVERISNLLLRGPGLAASPGAVAKVPHEAGYELDLFLYGLQLRSLLAQGWDLIHAWEEPYILAGGQIAYFTPRGTPLIYRTAQSISKVFPPPFSWVERFAMNRSFGCICSGQTVAAALRDRPDQEQSSDLLPECHGLPTTRRASAERIRTFSL